MNKFICLPLLLLLPWGVSLADDAVKDGSAFRTHVVKRGTVVQAVRATGTLEPEEIVDVGPQVDGRVAKLGADPKDATKTVDYDTKVKAGTILAQLDDSIYKARVEKAKAQSDGAKAKLQLAKAELAAAETDLARARKLLAASAISREDFDAIASKCDVAKARVQVAEAGVAAAEASLKEATINLDYTTIRSPVAGVVLDRRVIVGQAVTASLSAPSLFLIAKDLKRMQVWASVSEADISQVKTGQGATFTVDAFPDRVFKGKVAQVRLNATTVQNVVTYTVTIDTDNADGKLLPYLTADVKFAVAERKDVLLVPNEALRWWPRAEQVAADYRKEFDKAAERGTGTVWVEEKGHVRPIKLRLGVSDGSVTEVVEGELKEGTAVVIGEARGDPKGKEPKGPGEGRGSRSDPGADVLLIQPGAAGDGGVSFGSACILSLTAQDANAIRKECSAVDAVAPVVRARTQVVHGDRNWWPLYVYGTTPDFLGVRDWEVAEGRPFTSEELRSRKKVCLLGRALVKELFGGKSPLGKDVRIAGAPFEVVGVLERAGANRLGLDQDDVLLAPWTSLKDQLGKATPDADEGKGVNSLNQLYPSSSPTRDANKAPEVSSGAVDQILVRLASAGEAAKVKEQVTQLLRERHRIRKGQPDDFSIRQGMGNGKAAPSRLP